MTLIQSIILGIIQGLTEFLPISSSAHLVLIPQLLGWNIPEEQVFPFDVLVQLGTLVAVIIYYWNDLLLIIKAFFQGLVNRKPFEDPNSRLGWFLILATIPATIFGFLIKDQVEAAFNDANATAYFLYGTALLLVLAELLGKRSRSLDEIKWYDALVIGFFQAISIFPGISRSGATISGGMFRKFDRPSAARFSFLMSIPVMLGASLVSLSDVFEMQDPGSFLPIILAGFIAALLVGYLSIHWLIGFISKRSFYLFAGYCVLLASVILISGSIQKNAQAFESEPANTQVAQSQQTVSSSENVLEDNPLLVGYTPAVEWLLPAMTTCAGAISDFSIVTHSLPADQMAASEDIVKLHWGEPENLTDYSAVLGNERLALVVNPQNTLTNLTPELIQGLAVGDFTTWRQMYDKCPECFSGPPDDAFASLSPILNFYPSNDEAQQLFIQTVMMNKPVANATANLIPGEAQMQEIIAGTPEGFGFLPAHLLNENIKEIAVGNFDTSKMNNSILAITEEEPSGKTRDWLLCLQKALNP